MTGLPPKVEAERGPLPGDAVSHGLAVLSTLVHYNLWIFDSVRERLGPTIVEVGAGLGNITQFLLNAERLVCLEPFEPYRRYLASRFAKHLNVSVYPYPIEDCPNGDVPAGSVDSVVCLNVLEHISDDVEALRRMGQLLRPGGSVVVLAPALPCLHGAMDRAIGHFRRYTRSSLRRAFHAAGLSATRGRYMNLAGVLGWWWESRARKRTRVRPFAARAFDRLVPTLSALERLFPVPAGQSVIMVGRA